MGTASLSSPYSLHQYPYWCTTGIDRFPYVGNEGVIRSFGCIWLVFVLMSGLLPMPALTCDFSGWFYGDFFMDEYPASLDYSGIYR